LLWQRIWVSYSVSGIPEGKVVHQAVFVYVENVAQKYFCSGSSLLVSHLNGKDKTEVMTTDLNTQTTTTDSNLQFIREKIYQVRSAIMYSMSNELVKIPNNIITAVKVDEEGQLWFISKRPVQDLEQCEQSFPVRLHFFVKGRLSSW
jgi:hypothetical protein